MHRLSLILLLCMTNLGLADDQGFNGRLVIEPLGANNGRVMWLEISGAGTGSIKGFMVGGGPGCNSTLSTKPRSNGGSPHSTSSATLAGTGAA